MRIEEDLKLDFKDVLIRPKRSTLKSRKSVDLTRQYTFIHSGKIFDGIPIIAANMDTVGTFEMAVALSGFEMLTALHKHYDEETLMEKLRHPPPHYYFYSMGVTPNDYEKFVHVMEKNGEKFPNICIDVANGYSEPFVDFVKKIRDEYPNKTIMAGNVVTAEMTEALILGGADIVKVGIGPGSVCTTRRMTGVGYPQLSAVIECADSAHGVEGHICSDGGCVVPGDIAKAFGGGADFVMLGGMLAGHDECGGEIISDLNVYNLDTEKSESGKKFMKFYGMSSEDAMEKYSGGVADYRASEGKSVLVPYKGPVKNTVKEILGGLRSSCTYIGARRLKELSKRTTFVRVTQQANEVFGND